MRCRCSESFSTLTALLQEVRRIQDRAEKLLRLRQ
jgi:hypothetical protein